MMNNYLIYQIVWHHPLNVLENIHCKEFDLYHKYQKNSEQNTAITGLHSQCNTESVMSVKEFRIAIDKYKKSLYIVRKTFFQNNRTCIHKELSKISCFPLFKLR